MKYDILIDDNILPEVTGKKIAVFTNQSFPLVGDFITATINEEGHTFYFVLKVTTVLHELTQNESLVKLEHAATTLLCKIQSWRRIF